MTDTNTLRMSRILSVMQRRAVLFAVRKWFAQSGFRIGRKALGRCAIVLALGAAWMCWAAPPAQGQVPWLYVGPIHGDIGLELSGSEEESRTGASESKRSYSFTRESLNLNNRVVIYDPRFIDLNWGAGLTLGQGHGDSSGSNNQVTRYNLRMKFLKTHPYRLSLFSRKSEIDVEQTPAVRTTVERRTSGGTLVLKRKLGLPLPLSISYATSHSESENVNASLSEVDKFSQNEKRVDVYSTRHWRKVSLALDYHNLQSESFRGNPGAPPKVVFEQSRYGAIVNGKAGDRDRLIWRLGRRESTQDQAPTSTSTQSFGESRFKIYDAHASTLGTLLSFDVSEHESETGLAVEGERTVTESYRGGLDWRLFRSLFADLEHGTQKTVQPGAVRRLRDSRFGLRYKKKIPGGSLFATLQATLARIVSEGARIFTVIEEDHALVDFTPSQLLHSNIDVASIVVTDQSGTVFYVRDLDYRVVQNALTTSIERIPGTNILNGETVLVDYVYSQPGGELENRTRSYSLGFHWKFMQPFLRVTVFQENLLEGTAADQALLNPGRVTVYGLKLGETFWERFHPQVTAEREHSTRLLAPFRRYTRGASLGIDVATNAELAIHYARTLVDNFRGTLTDPVGTEFDSDTVLRRVDFHFTYGNTNGALEVSREDSRIGETDKEVLVRRATVTHTLGQWILASTLRKAEERFAATSNPDNRENSRLDYTLSVRRPF